MAKRHRALVPLTHDHHHALAQSRRLRQASRRDAASMSRAADDFTNFYLGRARSHFHEEEELFFAPLVDDGEAGPLIILAVSDHLRLHALVRLVRRQLSAGEVAGATLEEISDLLESHVRFEERDLFPLIEMRLVEDELEDLVTLGLLR